METFCLSTGWGRVSRKTVGHLVLMFNLWSGCCYCACPLPIHGWCKWFAQRTTARQWQSPKAMSCAVLYCCTSSVDSHLSTKAIVSIKLLRSQVMQKQGLSWETKSTAGGVRCLSKSTVKTLAAATLWMGSREKWCSRKVYLFYVSSPHNLCSCKCLLKIGMFVFYISDITPTR